MEALDEKDVEVLAQIFELLAVCGYEDRIVPQSQAPVDNFYAPRDVKDMQRDLKSE